MSSTVFDGLNTSDLRDIRLEVLLDPETERHARGRATNAGPVHPDVNDPVVGDFEQLDVAAIILYRWANPVDHHRDAIVHRSLHPRWIGPISIDRIAALCDTDHACIIGDDPAGLPAMPSRTTLER